MKIFCRLLLLLSLLPSLSYCFYPVSEFLIRYTKEHPKHLSSQELEKTRFSFVVDGSTFYGVREGAQGFKQEWTLQELNTPGEIKEFSAQALAEMMQVLLKRFISRGIDWTHLSIPKEEINAQGKDLRKNTQLTFLISTPIVTGSKITFAKEENPKLSKRIEEQLPSSLPDPSSGYPGDFIHSTQLNNYLHMLNRQPNRRVDLEVGSTGRPGEVAFDFIVTEEKPWHLYFNANSNVPRVLHRWQESVGFIHTQLSGNDDILKLDAGTDSFDGLYDFSASYERPLFGSFGTRWKVSGNYSRFVSAEFALPENLFVGTQAIFTGEIVTNIAQWKRLFLDFVADLQYRHIHNRGHALFGAATKNFLLPSVALKATRLKQTSKWIASLSLQSTMSSLFWDVRKNLNNLGREDISPNWGIAQGGLYGSFYLEPLWHRPERVKRLVHEIAMVGQFQNAFNQRLIPQLEAVLGGLYTIRGYPQSTVAGDNMYMGSLEYRIHLPQAIKPRPNGKIKLLGKALRWAPATARAPIDWDFLVRVFGDTGTVTVNQKQPGEKNYWISGAGLGAELILWHNIFIRWDWGRALQSANGVSRKNNQCYFSATMIY